MECIDELRNQIAVLTLRGTKGPQRVPGTPERRGGRRVRSDNRLVILDGQKMCVAEAARRLGITHSALNWRLVNRVGERNYGCVDVRQVGADRSKLPPRGSAALELISSRS